MQLPHQEHMLMAHAHVKACNISVSIQIENCYLMITAKSLYFQFGLLLKVLEASFHDTDAKNYQ